MPRRARRRGQPDWLAGLFRFQSRFLGGLLVACGIGSFGWAIVALLDLDIVRALAWLGLGIFLIPWGVLWWVGGEGFARAEHREHERSARAFWRGLRSATGTGRGSAVMIKDVAPPNSTDSAVHPVIVADQASAPGDPGPSGPATTG